MALSIRKSRSKGFGPRRRFEVFLRRNKRRVRFYTLTCGSEDHERAQVPIDFPEKVLQLPAEAAIEYEECLPRCEALLGTLPAGAGVLVRFPFLYLSTGERQGHASIVRWADALKAA